MKRIALFLIPALVAIFLSSCSTYDARFARGVPAPKAGDRFSGTYEGQWKSAKHPAGGGKLWCILQRQPDATYLAQFKATWLRVMSSEHSVVLHTRRSESSGRARKFTGTAALKTPVGPGTYRCEGTMDGSRMRACYDASYDEGTFDLKRVSARSSH